MKENKSLLNGRFLKCPRCKKDSSVETFMRLREAEEYSHETTPIYKCPNCKWIFALAVVVPQEAYEQLKEFFSSTRRSLAEKQV